MTKSAPPSAATTHRDRESGWTLSDEVSWTRALRVMDAVLWLKVQFEYRAP